jgi:hypothetical protein
MSFKFVPSGLRGFNLRNALAIQNAGAVRFLEMKYTIILLVELVSRQVRRELMA